jgi:hypothetical protein
MLTIWGCPWELLKFEVRLLTSCFTALSSVLNFVGEVKSLEVH